MLNVNIAQRQALRAAGAMGAWPSNGATPQRQLALGLNPGVSAQRQLALGLYPGASPQRQLALGGFGVYPNADSSDAVTAAINAFADAVNAVKSQIEMINAGLYAAASAQGGVSVAAWSSWHNEALSWENYAGTVVSQLQALASQGILTSQGWAAAQAAAAAGDAGALLYLAEFSDVPSGTTPAQSLVADFISQGQAVLQDAQATRSVISYDDSLSGAITDTLNSMLTALQNALQKILSAAGDVAVTATWAALKPILLVAGAAVGLLYLLKGAGVGANLGPVRFNGFNAVLRKKVGRRWRYRTTRSPLYRGRRRRKLHGRRTRRGASRRGFLGARRGFWLTLLGVGAAYVLYTRLNTSPALSATSTAGLLIAG